jgi:hypothetical protein
MPDSDQAATEALMRRLDELAHDDLTPRVERTTVFELVLDEDRFLIECKRWPGTEGARDAFEIQSIYYRHSWESTPLKLSDAETALVERCALRVVPELVQ